MKQEEEARKKEIEEQERQAALDAAANLELDNGETTCDTSAEGGKKGSGKKKNQKKKKSSNQRKNNSKKSQSGQDLTTKVYNTMEKHKEVFFTIRLHSAQSGASLGPIGKFDLPTDFISSEAMRRQVERIQTLYEKRGSNNQFSY